MTTGQALTVAETYQLDRAFAEAKTAQRIVDLTEDIATERPDVLVFLDKSARPISWGVRAVWPYMFPELALPTIKFLHFGREQWQTDGTSKAPTEPIKPSPAASLALKSHFSVPANREGTQRRSGIESGKTIWLIDDSRDTRTTLDMALELCKTTYPGNTFDWRALQCWAPPWYGSWYDDASHLGVADPADSTALRAQNATNKHLANTFRTRLTQRVIDIVN